MSLRVNLLKEDEYRYQGPVSIKFAGLAVAGLATGLMLLVLGFMIQREISLRKSVRQLESDWASLEPRYKEARQKRVNFASWQGMQQELKPWVETRVDWGERLEEMGNMVPPSIQLTRYYVHSDWEIIKPPPVPATENAEKVAKPQPAVPLRRFFISISGRAVGDAGGDDAVEMIRMLKSSAGYGAVFETIKLQHLLRDTQMGDLADRTFSIEGVGLPRKLE